MIRPVLNYGSVLFHSYADATIEECERALGADNLQRIREMPHPRGFCTSRAWGWWDASDLELHSLYLRLAELL